MVILPHAVCEQEGFKEQEVDLLLADGTICQRCWINQRCELEGIIVGGHDGIKPFGSLMTRKNIKAIRRRSLQPWSFKFWIKRWVFMDKYWEDFPETISEDTINKKQLP